MNLLKIISIFKGILKKMNHNNERWIVKSDYKRATSKDMKVWIKFNEWSM